MLLLADVDRDVALLGVGADDHALIDRALRTDEHLSAVLRIENTVGGGLARLGGDERTRETGGDIALIRLVGIKDGIDDAEFRISLNQGQQVKPLTEVASGGELSRIMLAIKAVMADKDEIETLIFDEIDVGISGRTAQKVSEKMALIGKEHQVICITHLAQIAAMADQHFLIEKKTEDAVTRTHIYPLTEEKSVEELARILGGAKITDTVIRSAKEMKNLAGQIK